MLDSYPGFETRDAELARAVTFEHFRGTYFDAGKREPFSVKANWVGTNKFRLTKVHCGGAVAVGYEAETVLRQYFPINPGDGLRFHMERDCHHLASSSSSIIVSAQTPVLIDALGRHDVLALRVETASMNAMISALMGEDREYAISFSHQPARETERSLHFRQAILQFIADIDMMRSAPPPIVLDVLGEALVLKFLYCNQHSLSEMLSREAAAPSLRQARRIEEYIESRSHAPLSMEDMARNLDISVRSIFRHFEKLHGTSPFAFHKSIRLSRARTMLQVHSPEVSVREIALHCGFSSFGRFAREYQNKFGELPSRTLRYARSLLKTRGDRRSNRTKK